MYICSICSNVRLLFLCDAALTYTVLSLRGKWCCGSEQMTQNKHQPLCLCPTSQPPHWASQQLFTNLWDYVQVSDLVLDISCRRWCSPQHWWECQPPPSLCRQHHSLTPPWPPGGKPCQENRNLIWPQSAPPPHLLLQKLTPSEETPFWSPDSSLTHTPTHILMSTSWVSCWDRQSKWTLFTKVTLYTPTHTYFHSLRSLYKHSWW